MTEPKSKSEKISKTTKTYLKELWIAENFDRVKEIESKYLEKGNLVEEKSITLLTSVTGNFFKKNEQGYVNDYICGTPDLFHGETVHDIKSSWDIFTFADCELTSGNYWQMMGYLWLTGKKVGFVDYCLVDTPDHLIVDAKRKWGWQNGVIDSDSPEVVAIYDQIEKNMTFSEIDSKKRVKQFEVNFLQSEIDRLIERIDICREFYKTIEL